MVAVVSKLILSNSKIAAFMRCPKKYEYSYDRELEPIASKVPLEFGRIFHAVLEQILKGDNNCQPIIDAQFDDWAQRAGESLDTSEYEKQKALLTGMVANYIDTVVPDDDFEVIATEVPFAVNVPAPNRHPSHTTYRGVIDALVSRGGRLYVMEHKSAKDIRTAHLMLDTQITRYCWAMREIGKDVKGVIYNIVRKMAPSARSKPPYTWRETIYRGTDVLDECGRELFDIAQMIRAAKTRPRNPTRDCEWDCPYRALCQAEFGGGDGSVLIGTQYQQKPEERKTL